jgi:hypothetical protein
VVASGFTRQTVGLLRLKCMVAGSSLWMKVNALEPGYFGRFYHSASHASMRTHPQHPHTSTRTPPCRTGSRHRHTGSYQGRHVGPPSQREEEEKEGWPPSPTRPAVLPGPKMHQPQRSRSPSWPAKSRAGLRAKLS